MPKTRLDRYSKPKAPPLDTAWGAVLVRQRQMDLSLRDVAERAGLSYSYVRTVWGTSPTEWPRETRDKLLAALGLKARLVIEDAGE